MTPCSCIAIVSRPVRQSFPDICCTYMSLVDFLHGAGHVFAVFDERTQDSGNISYGVEIDGWRYFVKTAGRRDDSRPYFDHTERVSALRNAVRLAKSSCHPVLPLLRQVIESPTGPMLVYDWVEGDLVRECMDRVRSLPAREIGTLLTEIYDLYAAWMDAN